jgi:hypothetical protein
MQEVVAISKSISLFRDLFSHLKSSGTSLTISIEFSRRLMLFNLKEEEEGQ